MNDHLDEVTNHEPPKRRRGPKPPAAPGGGAVYGLGVIGALVWYGRQAGEPREYIAAVLKALVWPAFLVYHALEVLHGVDTQGRSPAE